MVTVETGRLELTVARRGAQSIATQQFHAGALRILRPHYPEFPHRAQYTIINPGGGYFAGDHYYLSTQVEAGAQLELLTQSATKVYRSAATPATQTATFKVAAGASLCYLPEQLIMYADGNYFQDTTVHITPGGACLLGEIITPGWDPAGAAYTFEHLRLHTAIYSGDALLAVDRFALQPAVMPLAELGYLEGYSHIGQLLLVLPRLSDAAYTEFARWVEDFPAVYAGVSYQGKLAAASSKESVCLIVRALAHETAALQSLFQEIRQWWYAQLDSSTAW